MAKPLFAKCKRFFPDLPEHIFRNLLLVCSAIILARSTNLNALKDYLPQLLDNDHTKADSHYKRLIRFFRFTTPNRLVISILQFVFRLFDSRSSMAISFFHQGISCLRRHVQSLVGFTRYLESVAQTLITPKWVYVQ